MEVEGTRRLTDHSEIDLGQVGAQILENAVTIEATYALLKEAETSLAQVDKLSSAVKKIEREQCIQWTGAGLIAALGVTTLISKAVCYWQSAQAMNKR